jgi:hypothetical protein
MRWVIVVIVSVVGTETRVHLGDEDQTRPKVEQRERQSPVLRATSPFARPPLDNRCAHLSKSTSFDRSQPEQTSAVNSMAPPKHAADADVSITAKTRGPRSVLANLKSSVGTRVSHALLSF